MSPPPGNIDTLQLFLHGFSLVSNMLLMPIWLLCHIIEEIMSRLSLGQTFIQTNKHTHCLTDLLLLHSRTMLSHLAPFKELHCLQMSGMYRSNIQNTAKIEKSTSNPHLGLRSLSSWILCGLIEDCFREQPSFSSQISILTDKMSAMYTACSTFSSHC